MAYISPALCLEYQKQLKLYQNKKNKWLMHFMFVLAMLSVMWFGDWTLKMQLWLGLTVIYFIIYV